MLSRTSLAMFAVYQFMRDSFESYLSIKVARPFGTLRGLSARLQLVMICNEGFSRPARSFLIPSCENWSEVRSQSFENLIFINIRNSATFTLLI
jgi:hypothetical protein